MVAGLVCGGGCAVCGLVCVDKFLSWVVFCGVFCCVVGFGFAGLVWGLRVLVVSLLAGDFVLGLLRVLCGCFNFVSLV